MREALGIGGTPPLFKTHRKWSYQDASITTGIGDGQTKYHLNEFHLIVYTTRTGYSDQAGVADQSTLNR